MSVQLKPISEQVIVITGASSGIGLATAQMAARQGASVVLAARTEEALNRAVQEIAAQGGQAVAVVADVGVRGDLDRVAGTAIERFGRLDTWINNAGVGIWGRIEEVSLEDMRQLFDTNFWGVVHGSLAALPHLRAGGGALINVGSMASDRAIPIQGIYSASKHAIKGFTDALRMEVEEQGAPISVTLIKPASIGTPMPQHVKNYTGSEPKFPPPIYSPEDVARVILHAAAHPTRDAFVGSAARTISSFSQFAPRTMDRLSERALFKAQLGPKPPSPGDNLWHGQAEGKVHGDHQGSLIRPSLYSNAALHPAVTAAVAGAALAGMGYLMRRGRGTARRADGRSWLRQPGHRLSSDEAGAGADQIEARADGDIGLEADRGEGYSEGPGGQASGRVDHPSRHGTIPQHAEQLPDDLIVPLDGTRDEEARTTDRIQTF